MSFSDVREALDTVVAAARDNSRVVGQIQLAGRVRRGRADP